MTEASHYIFNTVRLLQLAEQCFDQEGQAGHETLFPDNYLR